MTNALTVDTFTKFTSKSKSKSKNPEILEVNKAISDVRQRLFAARTFFNEVTDEHLIDSCIYEINSLNSEYSHLLKKAQTLGATNSNFLISAKKPQSE